MPITDVDMNWKYGARFFPVHLFSGRNPLDHFTTGGAGTSNVSLGTGEGSILEISAALELTSLEMTAGDMIHTLIPLLDLDFDRSKEMEFRVLWIKEDAAADAGAIWKLHYAFVAPDGALGDAVTDADQVAATAAAAAGIATALTLEVSPWGRMATNDYVTVEDVMINCALELDVQGDGDDDDIHCLGMELRWTRASTSQAKQTTNT